MTTRRSVRRDIRTIVIGSPRMIASVESTYTDVVTSVFSTPIAFKAWFATAAGVLAIVQILTGARIFGKLERFVRILRCA